MAAPARAVGPFEWSVDNPFPLLDAEGTRKLAPDAGKTVVATFAKLTANGSHGIMPAVVKANLDGPGYAKAYARGGPRLINIRIKDAPADADCEWSTVPKGKAESRKAKCAEYAQITVPMGGGTVSVRSPQLGNGSESLVIDEKLIVGFGDSYSSGEGNPDEPAFWRFDGSESIFYGDPNDDGRYRWPMNLVSRISKDASWLHIGCHRSLWSYQPQTALAYATASPHRVVTFLFYSCAGALIKELTDVPQEAPGDPDSVSLPQIDQAVKDLCPSKLRKTKNRPLICRSRGMRRIDAILLTIGGNDAGFAKVIYNEVLPPGNQDPYACFFRAVLKPMTPAEAKARIQRLPGSWAKLQAAFERRLGVKPDRVFVPEYPNLLIDGKGQLCDESSQSMLESLRSVISSFTFVLTKKESEETQRDVITPMHDAIMNGSPRWSIINSHLQPSSLHGMCAVKSDPKKELSYPLPTTYGALWENAPSPERWRPYDASLPRWYRTPNDSILTLWNRASPWLQQLNRHPEKIPCPYAKMDKVQMEKVNTLRFFGLDLLLGSFHPTARYHSEVADAILPVLDARLAQPQESPRKARTVR